jgi:hypothetical protein
MDHSYCSLPRALASKIITPKMGPYQVLSHEGSQYQICRNLLTKSQKGTAVACARLISVEVAAAGQITIWSTDRIPLRQTFKAFGNAVSYRWLGYGPDDATSYASLKNNLVFHKYCREQNMAHRMPSEDVHSIGVSAE